MKTARMTTNLDTSLMDFLITEANKIGKSKRYILEEALKNYRKEKLKKEMRDGYNQMADDKEEMEMWLKEANHPENLNFPEKF